MDYLDRRYADRPSEIPVIGIIKKYPLLPRTKKEWLEDMSPKISICGEEPRIAKDIIFIDEDYLIMIIWPDSSFEGASGIKFCHAPYDHRMEHTQNREIIGIKPEYKGIPESWGDIPD